MNIQICVFSNVSALNANKRIFERIISLPFGVSVPYQQLVDDMKFLFGDTCIVTFICS